MRNVALNLVNGALPVVSLREFLRYVPRVQATHDLVATYAEITPHATYAFSGTNSSSITIQNSSQIVTNSHIALRDMQSYNWEKALLTAMPVIYIDPAEKRPVLDILNDICTSSLIYGSIVGSKLNERHRMLVKIMPRTWMIARPDEFHLYFKSDTKKLGMARVSSDAKLLRMLRHD